MAKFTLEIECDNAAFEGNELAEVGRILEALARELQSNMDHTWGALVDVNGNRVGAWDLKDWVR